MPEETALSPVLEASHVSVIREGTAIVNDISLHIFSAQRWVILGANGCGKTTLMRTLSLYLHPSAGDISVLGQRLGTFDIRPVRPRLAYVSASLASELRPALTALQVVMSAKYGALETWWNNYDSADEQKAMNCLDQMNVAAAAHRPIGSLSSGEQQRVLLGRALMSDPIALLLDEPSARLDLSGRESLVRLLDDIAYNNPALPIVVVTHHVDEIPSSTTHCALMKNGSLISAGQLAEALTSASLTQCFDIDLVVERRPNGRLTAYAP
jgi:iron complex transport system ATP-binding protein